VPKVRLIGAEGEQVGVVDTRQALQRARDEGYDLVEVAPNVNPPVCRIMDFGKYVYTLKKKEKEARKHQKAAGVKEIKFTIKISSHDYQTKLNHFKEFLEKGHKVKATMFLRGREITRADFGKSMMKKLAQELEDYGNIEKEPVLDGKIISLMFTPKSGKHTPSKGRTEQHGEKVQT
jgi:translation initiation factor IF-3